MPEGGTEPSSGTCRGVWARLPWSGTTPKLGWRGGMKVDLREANVALQPSSATLHPLANPALTTQPEPRAIEVGSIDPIVGATTEDTEHNEVLD